MSSTTQPTDFSDLYTDLLNRVRDQTGVTATDNQAKRYINIALHDMHVGFAEKVPWAERRSRLLLRPSYTTGTVSIDRGSSTLTGASTVWTTTDDFSIANARAGGKMQINGTPVIYEVSSVGGATAITLGSQYVGSDVAAGSTYVYFEDEYALASDFLRPIDAHFFDDARGLRIVSRTDFRQKYPRNNTLGNPMVCCFQDHPFSGNTTPVRKIRVAPVPNGYFSIPYSYVTSSLAVSSGGAAQTQLSAATDEPIVPLRYRHAIVFHALYHWYRDHKNDPRSQEAKAEYTDIMLRIGADQEVGSPRAKIQVRTAGYRARARRPYTSGSSRRYQTGTEFDDMKV